MSDSTNNILPVSKRLVSPMVLAYRLSYLLSSAENTNKKNSQNSDFFRITRKGLEALAENKETNEAQQQRTTGYKASISEAYIACTAYELECINCCLVKIDRKYLIASQEAIKKLKKLTLDDEKAKVLLGLSWDNLKQSVQASLDNKQPTADFNKAKMMEKGTGLPDGVVATDIDAVRDFHAQLEEIVSSIKKAEGRFQAEPGDLKFEKKSRAKKPSRKQVTYTPLTGE